jgi:hypothetical protein
MKLSGRETIMILGIVLIVLGAIYFFFILNPAIDNLNANNDMYDALKIEYGLNQTIIDENVTLDITRKELKDKIAAEEVRLLPELRSEVLAVKFSEIFEEANLPYIVEISCDAPVLEQVLLPDGTASENVVQWVTVTLKLSGTDGITPDGSVGGPNRVGYNEFMDAVRLIQEISPESIRISSIGMENTNQGFELFTISIEVYAFYLPDREVPIDQEQEFVMWERDDVITGGKFGIPYENLPQSVIDPGFFRPFAEAFFTNATVSDTITQ